MAANTVVCVTVQGPNNSGGSQQLDTALAAWAEDRDETVYIHVEQGAYTLGGDREYNQVFSSGGNASLHLVGGFVPGTSCQQRVIDASLTAIQGVPSDPNSLLQIGQDQGELLVDGFTFQSFARGMGLYTSDDGHLTLRNAIVTGMHAENDLPALLLQSVSGSNVMRLESTLVYNNLAYDGVRIWQESGKDSAQVLNSTIILNFGYGLNFNLHDAQASQGAISVYNSIIRDNSIADIYFNNLPHNPLAAYSDFNSVSHVGGALNGSNNVNVDPQYTGGGGLPYQQTSAQLVNKGAPALIVPGGYGDMATDLRGQPRPTGTIDIGAYESTVDDTAAQTVGSVLDGTQDGTLRAAIKTANSNPNPTTIKFNITDDGGCPHFISLDSLLDDITSDITIDGYSQPGALENTVAPGYNGSLCIFLRGNGLDHGLRTGSGGRLTVRGIAFDEFTGAAVRLSAGSGHVVSGNGFGGHTFQNNAVGVLVEGAATASRIGSAAYADRNFFGRTTNSAIKFDGNGAGNHIVEGNYIGFDANGSASNVAAPQYGIFLSDSGSNVINDNFIGNAITNAILLTGSNASNNIITANEIGFGPDGAPAGNGAGTCSPICLTALPSIALYSGAHDNSIGSTDCSASAKNGQANFIVGNHGPGVGLASSAGSHNRVCGRNLIYGNAGNLSIDLGFDGPTANDPGDTDAGPNGLQNYPVFAQALQIEANAIRVSGYLQVQNPGVAQGYRLDVYWTDTCVAGDVLGGRGELKGWLGYINLFGTGTLNYSTFSNLDMIATGHVPNLKNTNYYISAIATDAAGNTSEPGPCFPYTNDYVFSNGLE